MTRYASQVVELFEKVSFKTFDSDLKTQVSLSIVLLTLGRVTLTPLLL